MLQDRFYLHFFAADLKHKMKHIDECKNAFPDY